MRKLQQEKIYIVDDNLYYAELVARSLKNLGFGEVAVYESGEACLAAMTELPALVLMEYNMPGLSGLETLKQIKVNYPTVYVVMLTAQESIDVALDSLRFGAFDYLIKNDESPIKLPLILIRIQELERLAYESKRGNQ